MAQALRQQQFITRLLQTVRKEDLRLGKALVPEGEADMFAKGQRVDDSIVTALARGRIKMEDLVITGEAAVSASIIRRDIETLIALHEDLSALHRSLGRTADTVDQAIKKLSFPPELTLILTVMRSAELHLYRKTLLGAWLAVIMGLDIDLDRRDLDAVLRGAILRDIGMLYAPPKFLEPEQTQRLDREELADLSEHPQLGANITARGGSAFAAASGLVLEHHERVDGSGYPKRASGLDISPSARVIAICDITAAVRLRPQRNEGLQLTDTGAVLKLMRHGLCPVILQRFMTRLAPSKSVADERSVPLELINLLSHRVQELSEMVAELKERIKPRTLPGANMNWVRAQSKSTFALLRQSGLCDKELGWWLKQVANGREKAEPELIFEIELQQNEVLRRLGRVEAEMGASLTWSDVVNHDQDGTPKQAS